MIPIGRVLASVRIKVRSTVQRKGINGAIGRENGGTDVLKMNEL
jgi:hypothetical protein